MFELVIVVFFGIPAWMIGKLVSRCLTTGRKNILEQPKRDWTAPGKKSTT